MSVRPYDQSGVTKSGLLPALETGRGNRNRAYCIRNDGFTCRSWLPQSCRMSGVHEDISLPLWSGATAYAADRDPEHPVQVLVVTRSCLAGQGSEGDE